jgi:hypothetical protein
MQSPTSFLSRIYSIRTDSDLQAAQVAVLKRREPTCGAPGYRWPMILWTRPCEAAPPAFQVLLHTQDTVISAPCVCKTCYLEPMETPQPLRMTGSAAISVQAIDWR